MTQGIGNDYSYDSTMAGFRKSHDEKVKIMEIQQFHEVLCNQESFFLSAFIANRYSICYDNSPECAMLQNFSLQIYARKSHFPPGREGRFMSLWGNWSSESGHLSHHSGVSNFSSHTEQGLALWLSVKQVQLFVNLALAVMVSC